MPALKTKIKRRENWLSGDIQNEINEIMFNAVQRVMLKEIKACPFFGIIADVTTNVFGSEQFSISGRVADINTLKTRGTFNGLCEPPNATAETLSNGIKDVLLRLTLGTNDELRCHCFDVALKHGWTKKFYLQSSSNPCMYTVLTMH